MFKRVATVICLLSSAFVPIRHRSTFVERPLQINLSACKTKPISKMLKMNVNKVLTRDYENKRLRPPKNKPNQTQFH